jgi:hypothetical protein
MNSFELVTLTETGSGAWHVEVPVRHSDAPDGAMDLLITRRNTSEW